MTQPSRASILFAGIFLAVSLAQTVRAQVITGTIFGIVTDEFGAALPGASVTIRNVETGLTRSLATDAAGRYRAPGLSLGNYVVRAELAGFQPKAREGITLTIGREAVVNFTLSLGRVQEAIAVRGEAPLVNTTESTMSHLVDEKKIRDLPLNGRDFAQLILLQPGVIMSRASANSPNVGRGIKISVAGSRPNQNLFTLDGTDYNDALNNTPSSAQGLMTGVETIKEFQVLTNTMSAEYGRSAGGVFNVVTKSGTNDFHGSAFEFYRDDALNSKNFFDEEKPDFWRHQFGLSFGGPVVRNQTFFFASYEGLREFKGITQVATVPDDDAREGILPGRPRITINPNIVPYLNLYPRANGPRILRDGNPTGVAEFRGVMPRDSEQDFAMGRIDHAFSEKDSIFLRYIYDESVLDEPVNFPAFPNIVRNRKHVVTAEQKHVFSPAVLNELRLGFTHSNPEEDINPADPHKEIAFVPGKAFGEIQITGLTEIGTDRNNPRNFGQELYQVTDNIFLFKGRHAFKAGFNFHHFRYDGNSESRSRGRLRFGSLENFLRGVTRDFEVARPGSDFARRYKQSLLGIYVQDDFRASSRLTVNLGLRYEYITSPKEKDGKVSNLRNFTDSQMTIGHPLFEPPAHTLAPRLGFAWDVAGDGKTAVRGGYGIFYEQPLFYQWRSVAFRSFPYVDRAVINSPTLPIDPTRLVPGAPETEAFEFDQDPTYVEQYNVNVQRELPFFGTVMSVGYVGSRGHNLFGQGDVNIAVPQIQEDGTEFFPPSPRRRNSNFGGIRGNMQGFSSRYNGLHVGVLKPRTHGLQLQASYTYGKSLDNRSGTGGRLEFRNGQARTFDPYNFDRDKGRSDFDVRHSFVANLSYDLPLGRGRWLEGWQINLIGTYASGVPFSPIIPGDPDRDGSSENAGRPNVVPGCNAAAPTGGQGPNRWFNPECFSYPGRGFRGNAKRNSLEGPDLKLVDLSLVKTTTIAGNLQVQLRAEVFNLLNRANFGLPANDPDGAAIFNEGGARLPDAGKIFGIATDAREIQFAIKLLF